MPDDTKPIWNLDDFIVQPGDVASSNRGRQPPPIGGETSSNLKDPSPNILDSSSLGSSPFKYGDRTPAKVRSRDKPSGFVRIAHSFAMAFPPALRLLWAIARDADLSGQDVVPVTRNILRIAGITSRKNIARLLHQLEAGRFLQVMPSGPGRLTTVRLFRDERGLFIPVTEMSDPDQTRPI